MSIDTIDDLIDGKNFNILVEVLWGEKIDEVSNPYLNEKEQKIENFKNVIKFLESKNIKIPRYKILSMIEKKDTNNLLKILWSIISNKKIDSIYFNGIRGKDGLLAWINKLSEKSFLNFTDSLDGGKTIAFILNHFYPDEINLLLINNYSESMNFSNYIISIMQKIGAPILFNNEYFNNNTDEISIILQYAVLFEFLAYPFKMNFNLNGKYNVNYIYSLNDEPNFIEGIINGNDISKYITENNVVIQKINEHFNVLMHSRKPVQIAFLKKDGDEIKVEYNQQKFIQVMNRAGSRPIIFVICFGRYEQGKTTANSGITGNYGFDIGNGSKETTKGIYIDGPYDINYLYERFNVTIRNNLYYDGNELLTPLIFFFDVEGYEGNMHGSDIEKNNKAYIEMCAPFMCLSSIFLFFSEPNANQYEIKNFFERVKVSKLTTYSNKDTNGAIQLHIVFNQNNQICNYLDNNDNNPKNIKDSIQKFQKRLQKDWIGVGDLNKYGIEYNFYPILYGSKPYYDNGVFYEVFRYFTESIIRSIENAAEGRFIRSATQSISLYNYIIQHFNDESFGEMIPLLIKSEHENSFGPFSSKAYQKTKNKIFNKIEKEFVKYHNHNNFSINVEEIKDRYVGLGIEKIQEHLLVVQDHPLVFNTIENLSRSITNKVYDENDNLIKYKNKLSNEFIEKIEQISETYAKQILDQILSEINQSNNFDFNQSMINNCINKKLNVFKSILYDFKKSENLFLITDENIDTIISENQQYFANNVDYYIHQEKKAINMIHEEIEMKYTMDKLYKHNVRKEYNYIEQHLINELNRKLNDTEFYKENYKLILAITQKFHRSINNHILSTKNTIIDDICYKLSEICKNNSIIIERLKQKNMLIFDDIIHISIINENKMDLSYKIINEFNKARSKLITYSSESRTYEAYWFFQTVETRNITIYPEGKVVKGEWIHIRTQTRPFKEVLNDIVEPAVEFINKIMKS